MLQVQQHQDLLLLTLHHFSQFVRGRLALVLLPEGGLCTRQVVQCRPDGGGQANRPRLVHDGLSNGPAYPVGGIGAEPEPFPRVELLGCVHEAKHSLLVEILQVQEVLALVALDIAFGEMHHQAQVVLNPDRGCRS